MKDLSHTLFESNHWSEPELSEENFLANAIAMSLFTDGWSGELPPHENQHRGYWGDSVEPKGQLGSMLWTLGRAPLKDDTLEQAIHLAYEALSWLLEEGTVDDLEVTGRLNRCSLLLFIQVQLGPKSYHYELDTLRGRYE